VLTIHEINKTPKKSKNNSIYFWACDESIGQSWVITRVAKLRKHSLFHDYRDVPPVKTHIPHLHRRREAASKSSRCRDGDFLCPAIENDFHFHFDSDIESHFQFRIENRSHQEVCQ
jgi:hypothetical protein